MRNAYSILIGKHEGRDNVEDLGVDRRIILKSFKLSRNSAGLRAGRSGF
jgi:hypothetical protein